MTTEAERINKLRDTLERIRDDEATAGIQGAPSMATLIGAYERLQAYAKTTLVVDDADANE